MSNKREVAEYTCGHSVQIWPGAVVETSCPRKGCVGILEYTRGGFVENAAAQNSMPAHEFLEAGLGHMKDRATTYDAPQGERSMGKCVDMFRALTGIEMTEEQGWKFMCCLKLVRSEQGAFRADNFEDLAAYAGLAGEAASNGGD